MDEEDRNFVVNKVREILGQKGLDEIVEPGNDEGIETPPFKEFDSASLTNDQTASYSLPQNKDNLSIYFSCSCPEREGLQYEFILWYLPVGPIDFVSFETDQSGRLINDAEFGVSALSKPPFEGINTEQGAQFAPVFEKMLDIYLAGYAQRDS